MATCRQCDRWIPLGDRSASHVYGVCTAVPPTPIRRDEDNDSADPAGQPCFQADTVTSVDRVACVHFEPHSPGQGELPLEGKD
jgi:hypothetical protein